MRHRRRLAWVVVGAAVSVACTAPSQGSDTPVAQPVAAAAAASVASAPAGPVGSFMLALAAPAVLIERTKSGLERARAEGTRLGREPSLSDDQRADVRTQLAAGMSVSALARQLGVSRMTIMRARDAAVTGTQAA